MKPENRAQALGNLSAGAGLAPRAFGASGKLLPRARLTACALECWSRAVLEKHGAVACAFSNSHASMCQDLSTSIKSAPFISVYFFHYVPFESHIITLQIQ